MILIADSGSTKTDWVLASGDTDAPGSALNPVATCQTQGLNPVHQTVDAVRGVLERELLPALPEGVGGVGSLRAVYFYGSGCTPDRIAPMEQLLAGVLGCQRVVVASDLVAAAHCLCGRREGIACILGTGANSGLWDGEKFVQNTPALGYVLGDEGSGAVLGRLFLNAIFKDARLASVRDDFTDSQQLTQADVIRRVYREPMANRFLASLSPYISHHLDHPQVRALVVENFRQFFRANIVPYGRPELPVGFVGSMAFHYREQLLEAAGAEGFAVGTVVKSPMAGLLAYHARQ